VGTFFVPTIVNQDYFHFTPWFFNHFALLTFSDISTMVGTKNVPTLRKPALLLMFMDKNKSLFLTARINR